jgi:LacI family repressor for deo operon, udp, cdd, tsx, nupC, and nupG
MIVSDPEQKRHSGVRRRRKAVSFRDVAELAGVSTATVSRALSRPEMVASSTLERVNEAAKRSNLVVNAAARAFKVQRSNTLLVVAGDPGNPFNGEVIRGAVRRAHELNFAVMLSDHVRSASDQVRDFLSSRRGDGVALLWQHLSDADAYRALMEDFGEPPIVGVRQGRHAPPYPHVALDNEAAAYQLAKHIMGMGHTRIVVVAANDAHEAVADRIQGTRKAMAEGHLWFDEAAILHTKLSTEGGRRAAQKLLQRQVHPTAVICTNDLIAVGLVAEVLRQGLSVPFDISVTGFDDLPMVDCMRPALTTVRQPREDIGRHCVDLLVRLVTGKDTPQSTQLEMPLILRDSVAAPPAGPR